MKRTFEKTRRSALAGIAVVVLASSGMLPAQTIPGRYVAVLKLDTRDTPGAASALAAQHGLQLDHVYTRAIKGFAFGGSPQAAEALARRSEVAYVEPDQVVTAYQQTVPTGIRRCAAAAVPGLITGSGLTVDADVAVIDTGLDPTHPDLNVQSEGVRFYQNKNRFGTDSNWQDDNGHGTHVGGIIGAKDNGIGAVGVAPGARLWAVKVMDSSDGGAASTVLAGIDWVVQRAGTFEVANMSLGVGFSQAINDAVRAGTAAGIVFVVSAADWAKDAAAYSPASEPTALTVSALADTDGLPGGFGRLTEWADLDETVAFFSNYGQVVDVCAPGVEIYSTYPMSLGGYGINSGTSMAAAHVSGAAALYIARHGLAKNAAGVEAVCAAIRDSGWQAGHYASFYDWLYVERRFDEFPEPLLNVADLLYWESPATLTVGAPADATKVTGQTTIQATTTAPATAMQFYLDGLFLGEDTEGSDGWSINWDTTTGNQEGIRTLVAVATDGPSRLAGDAVLVGVNNSGAVKPSVRILEPYYDPWYAEPVLLSGLTNLTAAAFDMGSVVGVAFYLGSDKLGDASPGATGWTLAWDTKQTAAGGYILTAMAIGADGTAGVSMESPVRVANPEAIHIGDLDESSSPGSAGRWRAEVTVTVHDQEHNPLSGATVSGSWSFDGSARTGITDENGQCVMFSSSIPKRYTSVTFTVTGVTWGTALYEPSANHDPDGDSDGTSISVPKP